jgi:hypothetical protein
MRSFLNNSEQETQKFFMRDSPKAFHLNYIYGILIIVSLLSLAFCKRDDFLQLLYFLCSIGLSHGHYTTNKPPKKTI